MTRKTKGFVNALRRLCKDHGVEICKGSTFWVFGAAHRQEERIRVTDHFDLSMHSVEQRKNMRRLGAKSKLDVEDVTKQPVRKVSIHA